MNDLTSMLDVGCTMILKLAVACALLALAKLLRAWSKPKPETLVWASSGASTAAAPACQVVIAPPPKEEPQPEPEPEPEPEPAPAIQPNIVCGNCKGEIKSEAIDREYKDKLPVAAIHHCETCGMRVRVPLTT